MQGRIADSIEADALAADLFQRAGALRQGLSAQTSTADSLWCLGQLAQAEARFEAVRSLAERLGMRIVVGMTHLNLANVRLVARSLSTARTDAEAAVTEGERTGSSRLASVAHGVFALVLDAQGELGEAMRHARLSLELAKNPMERVTAHARLAAVLVDAGEMAEALEVARAGMHMLEPTTTLEDNLEATLRLAYAEALWAAGEREQAVLAIRAARARILERAGAIGRPEWRESFLRVVPQNARVLERAADWGA
jgi:hypothetical protein